MRPFGTHRFHDPVVGPVGGHLPKTLTAGERGAHVTEGPAFDKLNLPVFGVTGDHRIDHVETGHAIGELIFASL